MKEQIEQVKESLIHTANRMLHNLDCVPDERINWSPSPTARTPLQQVAHAALSVTGIQFMLQEEPRLIGEFGKESNSVVEWQGEAALVRYPFESVEALDIAFRAAEGKYSSRQQVKELLDDAVAGFNEWLDALTPVQFESTLHTHFGALPMSFGITLPALHTEVHISQLEYIQTIYGDMIRH